MLRAVGGGRCSGKLHACEVFDFFADDGYSTLVGGV